jgi:hypothetical protein
VFLVFHGDLWVTIAIDDLDGIPVGLHTVHHEALKLGFSTPFFLMSLLSFLHIIHWAFVSSDCMSYMAMVMILKYVASYT